MYGSRAAVHLLLFPRVLSSHIHKHWKPLAGSAFNSNAPKDLARTESVRMAALACATISVTASIVAFYWFCRMEKRFRHRLIMLLISGDLIRGVWYLVFAVISQVGGIVNTETSLCQSSGFFVQYGTETSDYAVLVIAVHNALQIFRPRADFTSDGLYPYRHCVYAGALVFPILMSSLAFINPRWGYFSQGAFCSLPLRPFWFRLALNWVPRYLIALIILGLAIAIYAYVGFEFRLYSNIVKSNSDSTTLNTTAHRSSTIGREAPAVIHDLERQTTGSRTNPISRRSSSIAHDIMSSLHRTPTKSSTHSGTKHKRAASAPPFPDFLPASNSLDLPLQRSATIRPPLFAIHSGRSIQPSTTIEPVSSNIPPPETTTDSATPLTPALPDHMARERARVQRQLRLLFIYPLAYTIMWLFPFIQHCMMYRDEEVRMPNYGMRVITTICYCTMGLVNGLIFSLREKPWRSIHRSDGTFWGSFAVWHFQPHLRRSKSCEGMEGRAECAFPGREGDTHGAGAGTLTHQSTLVRDEPAKSPARPSAKRMQSSVRVSTSTNDNTNIAAEQALIRLELEKEERFAALRTKSMARRISEGLFSDEEDEWDEVGDGEGSEEQPEMSEKVDKGKGKAMDEEEWVV